MVRWGRRLGMIENDWGNWLMYKIKVVAIDGMIILGFVGAKVHEVLHRWEVGRII